MRAESPWAHLRLPAVAAPMTAVTGPELVLEAVRAGVMGVLPRHNADSLEEFSSWLGWIRERLHVDEAEGSARDGVRAPLAVNLSTSRPPSALVPEIEECARHGVEIVITALGDPTEMARVVHDHGLKIFHDVTQMRFAEKAAAAGVDGMTCIVAGGGGHSGLLSPFVFVPAVREFYGGTILLAGAIGTGAAVRAAEILGADLAYLGTRFIATAESRADPAYKRMLVESRASDLAYTAAVTSVPANWLKPSLRRRGLDPEDPPRSRARGNYDHLPDGVRPWRDIWSAGQGIELIRRIPTVGELVDELADEYERARAM